MGEKGHKNAEQARDHDYRYALQIETFMHDAGLTIPPEVSRMRDDPAYSGCSTRSARRFARPARDRLHAGALRCHAGIHRAYFGAVERGEFNITIGTLTTIAAGLDVPAWTLLEREPAGESDA